MTDDVVGPCTVALTHDWSLGDAERIFPSNAEIWREPTALPVDGRCSFDKLPPGTYRLALLNGNHPIFYSDAVAVAAGQHRVLDVSVKLAHVHGVIVAPHGVGAQLIVALEQENAKGVSRPHRRLQYGVRADEGGRFSFDLVAPGRYTLTAFGNGLGVVAMPLEVSDSEREVNLTLAEGGALEVIVDRGAMDRAITAMPPAPPAEILLSLHVMDADGRSSELLDARASLWQVGSKGEIVLTSHCVPAGQHDIEARLGELSMGRATIDIAAGSKARQRLP